MKKILYCSTLTALGLFLSFFIATSEVWAISHDIWLPYNVKNENWWTGLHIRTSHFNETIKIDFWSGNAQYPKQYYATKDINVTDGEWTGLVKNLLENPSNFVHPTMLHLISTNGRFMVTQFLGNTGSSNSGFSHQTFFSYPGSQSWIYEDTSNQAVQPDKRHFN